jgi:exopolyphosphatase / guanosine-5'-triphosphate,3'-diphosphate pyrophosphatase
VGGRADRGRAPSTVVRLAAVDVGTNAVRLLVADVDGTKVSSVLRDRIFTRLGKDVHRTRKLDPKNSAATMEAIEGFVQRARELGAEHLRIAGTSALRDAADGAEFVSLVSERTGIGFEVLSGTEEARIGFTGATSELPAASGASDGPYVVCDIGGGSTELTVGDERPKESVSVDVGSVRVTESCLHSDPPTEGEVAEARSMIEEAVDAGGFDRSVSGRETFVGIGGTVQTVAALVLELGTYDFDAVNLSRSCREDVAKITQRLLSTKVEEIRKVKVIDAGRTDVIAAGSLILLVLMERWAFPEVLASGNGMLHGLVLDLAQQIA